jgi:hypothetical protein
MYLRVNVGPKVEETLLPVDSKSATTYSPPKLVVRTVEQAKLLLVGHAWIGHRGARDLLELLFSDKNVVHGHAPSHASIRGGIYGQNARTGDRSDLDR